MDFTYLKNFMDNLVSMGIPGNAAIVYKDGKKVFEYSSGFSSMENKTEMDTKTLLNIYSCSKVLNLLVE